MRVPCFEAVSTDGLPERVVTCKGFAPLARHLQTNQVLWVKMLQYKQCRILIKVYKQHGSAWMRYTYNAYFSFRLTFRFLAQGDGCSLLSKIIPELSQKSTTFLLAHYAIGLHLQHQCTGAPSLLTR